MRPRPYPLSLALALAIAGLSGVSSWAGAAPAATKVKAGADKDNTLPASVRRIERETGGQVLRAQPIQRDGREIYRVKVVTPQGRVRVLEDDAGRAQPLPPPPEPLPPPAGVRHHP